MAKARETRPRFRGKAESLASAKNLAAAVEKARTYKQRIALKRAGRTVAAVVPAEDLATLERLDDLADAEAYRLALAEWERDGKRTITLETVIGKLGIRP